MDAPAQPPSRPSLKRQAAWVAVHFSFLVACLALARSQDELALVWLPNGIAVAALRATSPRFRGWILGAMALSNVLGNSLFGDPLDRCLQFAIANTVETLACVLLMERTARKSAPGGYRRFLAAEAAPAAALGATVGVLLIPDLRSAAGHNWFVWFLSDLAGLALMAPVALAAAADRSGQVLYSTVLDRLAPRLVLAAGVALSPLLIFGISEVVSEREKLVSDAQLNALYLARAAALRHDGVLESTRDILRASASTLGALQDEQLECGALGTIAHATPGWLALDLIATDGGVLCPGNRTPAELQDLASAARDTRAAAVSVTRGPFIEPDVQRSSFLVTLPLGPGGDVLAARVDLVWLSNFAGQILSDSAGMDLVAVEPGQRVVARYPDPERFLGMQLPLPPKGEVRGTETSGTVDRIGADGVRRVGAYANLSGGGWVGITVRKDQVLAGANHQVMISLALILSVSSGITGLLWLAADQLVLRGLSALLFHVRRMAGGVRAVAIELPEAGAEVRELADAFQVMEGRVLEHEEQLAAARSKAEQADRAKSEFLATMSHEIRTPLNGVIGFAELLTRTELNDQQRRYAETLRSAGKGLLTIVNDILDILKLEAGRLDLVDEAVALPDLLNGVMALMDGAALSKGLILTHHCDPALPSHILGDETRLRQVLLNLVGNAVKFTDTGRVDVNVRLAGAVDGKPQVRFTVQDSGIGIPADKLGTLFREFTQIDTGATRRFGGTGLGLAISKRLVEGLGGRIGVESTLGKGSLFWFELPLRPAAAPVASAPARPGLAAPAPRHLLLAEDIPMNQEVARTVLEHAGHRVDVAADGAQAIALMRQESYDLVLMDVRMPVMDGLEATRRIRRDLAWHGPVIGLTANSSPAELQNCRAAGMDTVITKPFDPERLLTIVEEWLGHAPAARQPIVLQKLMAPEKLAGLLRDHVPGLRARAEALADDAAVPLDLADWAHALASPLAFLGLAELQRRCLAAEADWRAARPVASEMRRALARDIQAALERLMDELPAPSGTGAAGAQSVPTQPAAKSSM